MSAQVRWVWTLLRKVPRRVMRSMPVPRWQFDQLMGDYERVWRDRERLERMVERMRGLEREEG